MKPASLRAFTLTAVVGVVCASFAAAPGPVAAAVSTHPDPVKSAVAAVADVRMDGDFRPESSLAFADGSTTVRFTQQVNGVEVIGGYASVTVAQDGSVLQQTVSPGDTPAGTYGSWTSVSAHELTRQLATKWNVPAKSVELGGARPVVVDARVVPGFKRPEWAWRLIASLSGDSPRVVFADDQGNYVLEEATSRAVVDSTPLICKYDISNYAQLCSLTNSSPVTLGVGLDQVLMDDRDRLRGNDSRSISGAIDMTQRYFSEFLNSQINLNDEEYLGNIAPENNFGAPSANAHDTCTDQFDQIIIDNPDCTPRIGAYIGWTGLCATCEFVANAQWFSWDTDWRTCNSSSCCRSGACGVIQFGKGWAVDDIIAHEITHGVTASKFSYRNIDETNALAEAYSDFIGEAVDQRFVEEYSHGSHEAPDPSWKFGEDVGVAVDRTRVAGMTGYNVGPFRTLSATGNVFIKNVAEHQFVGHGWNRFGEEHENAGPPDRFFWLLANGGAQRGYRVFPLGTTPVLDGNHDGLCNQNPVVSTDPSYGLETMDDCTGITMATTLVMRGFPNLPKTGSTFYDFAHQTLAACDVLVAQGIDGFTPDSCTQVRRAAQATNIFSLSFGKATKLGKVRRGSTKYVKAVLKTSTGARAIGVPVALQTRAGKRGAWTTVATGTTSTTGLATLRMKVSKARYYRVVTVSSSDTATAVTATRLVTVR